MIQAAMCNLRILAKKRKTSTLPTHRLYKSTVAKNGQSKQAIHSMPKWSRRSIPLPLERQALRIVYLH